jgi:membrane protein implicated in regulation of membrane protease activity
MTPSWRRIVVVYTALRFVVFLGCAGVLVLLGFNGLPLLAIAVLISSIVSYVVLKPQRLQLTEAQVARREARAAERDERRARLESS